MANRLTSFMTQLVDPTHTVFLQGYILDNVLAAHKIIHYSKIHQDNGLVLKVNFEKGCDKVN
jgi:hypothetical protein